MKAHEWITTVIPAAPGYRGFHWEVEGGEVHIMPAPVIAWKVMTSASLRESTVEPITDDAFTPAGVLRPDGTVFLVQVAEFGSVDDFKAQVLAGKVSANG